MGKFGNQLPLSFKCRVEESEDSGQRDLGYLFNAGVATWGK